MCLGGWKKIRRIIETFLGGMNTICLWWPDIRPHMCQVTRPSLNFRKISKIFGFVQTFFEPKIYLYLMDFFNFWFSEKLWVWKARKSCLCSPWAWPTPLLRENVKWFFAKIQIGPLDLMCTTPQRKVYFDAHTGWTEFTFPELAPQLYPWVYRNHAVRWSDQPMWSN